MDGPVEDIQQRTMSLSHADQLLNGLGIGGALDVRLVGDFSLPAGTASSMAKRPLQERGEGLGAGSTARRMDFFSLPAVYIIQ